MLGLGDSCAVPWWVQQSRLEYSLELACTATRLQRSTFSQVICTAAAAAAAAAVAGGSGGRRRGWWGAGEQRSTRPQAAPATAAQPWPERPSAAMPSAHGAKKRAGHGLKACVL